MTQIPQEIKKKIFNEVTSYTKHPLSDIPTVNKYTRFAEFGYSLAAEQISKRDEQIKELVEALYKINHTCGTVNFSSHNQLKEAIEEAVAISDELLTKHKTIKTEV